VNGVYYEDRMKAAGHSCGEVVELAATGLLCGLLRDSLSSDL
jgi:hypothetical protein